MNPSSAENALMEKTSIPGPIFFMWRSTPGYFWLVTRGCPVALTTQTALPQEELEVMENAEKAKREGSPSIVPRLVRGLTLRFVGTISFVKREMKVGSSVVGSGASLMVMLTVVFVLIDPPR